MILLHLSCTRHTEHARGAAAATDGAETGAGADAETDGGGGDSTTAAARWGGGGRAAPATWEERWGCVMSHFSNCAPAFVKI